MFDGSTPTSDPAPFAVGYGNGYGYESAPTQAIPAAEVAVPTAGDLADTVEVTRIDLEPTVAVAAASPVYPPYRARPVGAAHPRRRLGRGLVLAGLTLAVAGAGIGAVTLASSGGVSPAAASASTTASGRSAAPTAALGGQLGSGVDPTGPTVAVTVPASVIESPTVTRVLPPVTTVAPPTTAPTTTPPATVPPTTAPPTTAPPATTPPTTAPTGPTFTSVTAPSSAGCPTPSSDVTIAFSWSATGTTKVTLSIDGPGVYRTYQGASGSETVNFACGQSHTYLFTAYGADNAVTTTSVTVAPV